MVRTSEEILVDIDATLDHLIENARVINLVSVSPLFTSEVEGLQKTQESLLSRLVHMNDLLKEQKSKKVESFRGIEKKILKFGKLNAQMINNVTSKIKRAKKNQQVRVRPNRKKAKI